MTEIRGGVAPEVWADVETRMPELAALAGPQR